jgi:hypothetical protein
MEVTSCGTMQGGACHEQRDRLHRRQASGCALLALILSPWYTSYCYSFVMNDRQGCWFRTEQAAGLLGGHSAADKLRKVGVPQAMSQ